METRRNLKELFDSHKDELSQKLSEYVLPRDAGLVQSTVTNYLNGLFNAEGDYRQSLTQSEDYILQAAISLLHSQQSMIGELAYIENQDSSEKDTQYAQAGVVKSNKRGKKIGTKDFPYVIGGSAVGCAVGSLMLGSWGAVFGSIAGTALVLYYSSSIGFSPSRVTPNGGHNSKTLTNKQEKINVEVFIGIVGKICVNVDLLIQTFRAQVNRVVDKYESQEKPVLEKDYRFLIENIQTLVGYKRTHTDDEKYLVKLQQRIEDLTESLENYGYSVEDYTEEHQSCFDMVESSKVQRIKMVYPAIVKNGLPVLLGKVFVPERK